MLRVTRYILFVCCGKRQQFDSFKWASCIQKNNFTKWIFESVILKYREIVLVILSSLRLLCSNFMANRIRNMTTCAIQEAWTLSLMLQNKSYAICLVIHIRFFLFAVWLTKHHEYSHSTILPLLFFLWNANDLTAENGKKSFAFFIDLHKLRVWVNKQMSALRLSPNQRKIFYKQCESINQHAATVSVCVECGVYRSAEEKNRAGLALFRIEH